MASLGLPLPVLATILAVVVECVGGLLVVIGYQTRTTALVLAAWSVATALVAHTHFSDPNQMINFLKTSRWLVGFPQLFVFGGGAWSVDASRGPVAA
jgi:putative oxidoreductase